MKTFRFIGKRTYVEYFKVDIEAETLEEAKEVLNEGDFDEYDHQQEFVSSSDEIEFDKEL